jgi:hypothetical protein
LKPIPPELRHDALAAEVIRRAVARLDEDRAFSVEAHSRYSDAESKLGRDQHAEVMLWERWANLAQLMECESRNMLVRCVLATGPDKILGFHQAELHQLPARGGSVDGRLFVAYPDPNRDGIEPLAKHPQGQAIMMLVELPLADLVAIG